METPLKKEINPNHLLESPKKPKNKIPTRVVDGFLTKFKNQSLKLLEDDCAICYNNEMIKEEITWTEHLLTDKNSKHYICLSCWKLLSKSQSNKHRLEGCALVSRKKVSVKGALKNFLKENLVWNDSATAPYLILLGRKEQDDSEKDKWTKYHNQIQTEEKKVENLFNVKVNPIIPIQYCRKHLTNVEIKELQRQQEATATTVTTENIELNLAQNTNPQVQTSQNLTTEVTNQEAIIGEILAHKEEKKGENMAIENSDKCFEQFLKKMGEIRGNMLEEIQNSCGNAINTIENCRQSAFQEINTAFNGLAQNFNQTIRAHTETIEEETPSLQDQLIKEGEDIEIE